MVGNSKGKQAIKFTSPLSTTTSISFYPFLAMNQKFSLEVYRSIGINILCHIHTGLGLLPSLNSLPARSLYS
jgi:hypothetical protein